MLKNVLVTGARGLVGSCIDAEYKIDSEIDLRDSAQVKKLFKEKQPENVIHLAAKVGGLGSNSAYKGEYFYDNVLMNSNVIHYANHYNVKRLVAFMSTCIFPDKIDYPLTTDKIHLGPPHFSNYPYAYAKRMIDVQIRAYREQYDCEYTSVIPTNIYGPKDNFSLTHGHVVPMLIHKFYLAKKNKTAVEIWGTGKAKREFIFSEDVANLTLMILEDYNDEEPIILSTNNEISIKDLVGLLVEIYNFKGKVIFNSDKPDGQLRKPSDSNKIRSLFPNYEYKPLEIGLSETVNWFVSNYELARK